MTDLPDLPDQVLKAMAPKEPSEKKAKRSKYTSPFRPDVGDEYKRPAIELIALALPAVILGFAGYGIAPESVLGNFIAVVVLLAIAVLGFLEWRKQGRRAWTYDSDSNVYRWHDDSGEWDYSGWQSDRGARVLRWLVALAVPASFAVPFALADEHPGFADALWYVILACYPVLIYVYRHLPTRFHPASQARVCDHCGTRRHADSVRICPRCGRVTDVYHYAATPSLRRRFSSF